MKTTRQRKGTEQRVIVTLARHERQTPATIIINKLRKSKTYRDKAAESGASVYYEQYPGKPPVFLYMIRPEQISDTVPYSPPFKSERVLGSAMDVSGIYEKVKADR